MDEEVVTTATATGRRRIPKACGSCRFSKVKCDGLRPCSRCRSLKKTCEFVERPPNPQEQKINSLEKEVYALKQSLQFSHHDSSSGLTTTTSNKSTLPSDQASNLAQNSPETLSSPASSFRKRKRSQCEVEVAAIPNFAAKGLITLDQAEMFFNAFFQGCDRYVPIFDSVHDTFQSISSRSSLLFNAIVTVGCGVLGDADSQICHLLNFHLKKTLNLVIVSPQYASLETVQALLVTACYVSERSLLLAFATRMALDLGLPDTYEDLTRRLVSRGSLSQITSQRINDETDAMLMRRSRAWFQLMILEQILHVDAGNLRSFQLKGDPRRCRILLNKPFTTTLDLRLLSQVELNALRGRVHDSISGVDDFDDEEVMDILRDVQVDIDVWYNDWKNIMQSLPTAETPVLLLNLTVQKFWSQAVAACRALRALGIDNIDAMSNTQREILQMAKDALEGHLRIILDQPRHYLSKFCYAMDFVWAKCAFCFLLLLKLTRLLPENDDAAKRRLLDDGHKLLRELNKAAGGVTSGGRTNTSRMYLQVLQQSIQKYGQALGEDGMHQVSHTQTPESPLNFFWMASGANNEIDSFMPEQFVFEWDFPGLTLFSATRPATGDSFFDEFLMGNGVGDSMFLGVLG